MKWFTSKKEDKLKKEIDTILTSLNDYETIDENYEKRLSALERLEKIKSAKDEKKIKPDTIAIIAANLLGIALILGFEKANVITSKALGFVLRGRV